MPASRKEPVVAEGLILEFSDVSQEEYDAVNGKLGIDMTTGSGDWPEGLQMHFAGNTDRGTFVVTEVWATRADQEAFMQSRLGAALAAGGVTGTPTVTWVPLYAFHTPAR
jgi:hypothetical protein